MKLMKRLVFGALLTLNVFCLTTTAQQKRPVKKTKNLPAVSNQPIQKKYKSNLQGNCYYLNTKGKRIFVNRQYCSQTPPAAADPTPAHKVLPATREIEKDEPAPPPVNPNEPEPVVPVHRRPKAPPHS